MNPLSSTRRVLLALGLALAAVGAHAEPAKELRIGFQKSASLFVLQKAQGTLEKRLAPQGVAVKWVEFPAGPQLLEGLNVGAIDVGFVGEAPPIFAQAARARPDVLWGGGAPPIFAQAAGARFVYVGNDPAAPLAEALVVPKDSPLKSVADLKGKRIALNKGSNVHYLLVKVLEKSGLKYSDITPVFLPPADEQQTGARQLADGTGVVSDFNFYLAQTDYAQANPAIIRELFANTQEAAKC